MFKLRSLFPIGALLAAATLFAQDVPPPPKAPAAPPADPAPEQKRNIFGFKKRTPATTPAPAPGAKPVPAPAPKATPAPAARPAATPAPKAKATPPPRVLQRRVPVATPLPVDPNQPKKPGFWSRMLGRKDKPEATPAPAKATPTPKPRKTRAKTDRPAPTSPETPDKPEERPPETEPKPEKPAPQPKATPAPKVSKTTKPAPAPADDEGADAEIVEREKFTAAKAKALEDSDVQELKLKADTAPTEEEARKAMRAYNKALFRKMRAIEPGIKDRIDATEAAIMRRLGE